MLARDCIAHYRRYLDTLSHAYPVLEWGLRWCEINAPQREETTFIHRDYRTGNYLVHDGRLAGVLDWEFPAFGNPLEDIGWICARCWRFARPDLVVGGIAGVEDFIPEYERVSGRQVSVAGSQLLAGHGTPALGGDRIAATRAASVGNRALRSSWR